MLDTAKTEPTLRGYKFGAMIARQSPYKAALMSTEWW